MEEKFNRLKLENQLCFPLYACSKEVIRQYNPLLEELDLTYTQYIAMMVFWEEKTINVKELGKKLYLDSGTLTPVLKNLEAKGYLRRHRSSIDERVLIVDITQKGEELRKKALSIPDKVASSISLNREELTTLYSLLHKILDSLGSRDEM